MGHIYIQSPKSAGLINFGTFFIDEEGAKGNDCPIGAAGGIVGDGSAPVKEADDSVGGAETPRCGTTEVEGLIDNAERSFSLRAILAALPSTGRLENATGAIVLDVAGEAVTGETAAKRRALKRLALLEFAVETGLPASETAELDEAIDSSLVDAVEDG